MKKILCYLIICLMMAVSISPGETQKTKTELSIGNTFPKFIATDIYGKVIDIENFKKVTIVSIEHFGQQKKQDATERKRINDFYKNHKDNGLELIRIASKKGIPPLISKSFIEDRARKSCIKHKEGWTVIIDWDCSLKKLCKMNDEPLVFVLDKQGIIRYRKEGYLIVDNILYEIVQKLLKEERK